MYLSRIELDTRLDKTLRAVSMPTLLHAAVEGCFSQNGDGKSRKLWRLDPLGGKLYLLLLSSERPDFAGLSAQFALPGVTGETKDYAPLLARLEKGQIWRFRLRANPVHSVPQKDKSRGKPQAHTTAEHQREWLSNRAERYGFSLKTGEFDIVQVDSWQFHRTAEQDRNKNVTLGTAVYEGLLTVTDVALFRGALLQGIGRAKAYGCGLLTVARAK